MKKYRGVIFDFDGTLSDSLPGVALSAQHALREEFGIEKEDLGWFRAFVGPPLHDSFTDIAGLSPEDAARAVKSFRKRYGEKGYKEMALYPGISEMLTVFAEKKLRLAIASSKVDDMLLKSLKNLNIEAFFDAVVGGGREMTHVSKAELIAEAVRRIGLAPADCLMVGDRCFDAEGAMTAGVDFAAALYAGFGPPEEFLPYPAVFRANRAAEITDFVLLNIGAD